MKQYLKLMRVHHYIKNLLIFAPLACSGQFFVPQKLAAGLIAFVSFCMISSVVYVINDIRDVEKDRMHPTKCARPIAAGTVSIRNAWILAAVLAGASFVCTLFTFQPISATLLLLYLILNLAYSFGLKNVPIIDITILVAGFLIRVLYGAYITQISVSNWLYLTVVALAFYFALGKRRNELKQIGNTDTRKVLQAYPISFLNENMMMCLTLANVFYALWSMDAKTASFYNNDHMVFTVPIVFLITMKYSLDIEGQSDGDPVEVLLHDKVLLALCLIYFVAMFTILYL